MKTISKKVAKKVSLVLVMFNLAFHGFSAIYYVSNIGNDTNSGLTTSLPWQTLSKVNSVSFVAGDQILFQRGSTFYGSLSIKNSGTSGNPITFGAYGTGANPIITGFTTVSAWTNLGSNIWESTNAISTLSTCNIVAVNGTNVPMGRYPNSGYLTYQSHSGSTSITSSSLSGTPDWTGAEVVIKNYGFIFERGIISSQSTGTLIFSPAASFPPLDGQGFFIQNDSRTLDQQNEWYYNPSTKKIRIYSTSQPVNVQVSTVIDDLITAHGSYITLDNISLTGANKCAIYNYINIIDYFTIQNCSISNSGINGVQVWSEHFKIENCSISNSNNYGIKLPAGNSNIIIRSNTIQNSGMFAGMGVLGGYSGIDVTNNSNSIIEYNNVINSGYKGISWSGGASILVKNNFVDTFCKLLDDGGGIYWYTANGGRITGNIVINGVGTGEGTTSPAPSGTGIYSDDNSVNFEIDNNTTANCNGFGLFLHNSRYINAHNNTSYNNGRQLLTAENLETGVNNNTIINNLFISKTNTQYTATFFSDKNNLSTIGTLTNNIYARPIDDNTSLAWYQPSIGGSGTIGTLTQWQSYSSQDASSKKSPQTLTAEADLQFEYNATSTVKTVSLSRLMIDMKGSKYPTSITLQPYTSVVLMKDSNPATAPSAPTSVVATAKNASATVTFAAPLNIGGSAIIGYTVTSLPSGGIDINAGSTSLTHTISGLVNGTSYTFTVKASNSAGASVASAASNAVTPVSVSSTEYKSICEGASYSGWTITGKYSRTLTTKTGGDSIVTTYLTVNPKYTVNEDITIDQGLNYNGWTLSGQYSRTLSSVNGCDSTIITNLTVAVNSTKLGATQYTQTIELKKGYNMVSTYVDPSDPSVNTVTQAIRDNGNLIKVQDESGNSYENWGNLGGWINNLGSLKETEGYKIRVADNCSLQVTGTSITLPLDITLNTGWNIISFPRTDVLDAMTLIQPLIDQNLLIKVQDEAGNSIENWGIYGGWKNGIGNFNPGRAYRVKVNASAILNIRQSYPKSAIVPIYAEQTSHFSSVAEGNGYEHENINLVGLNGSGLVAGDELAAYDGNLCVGTLKITEQMLIQGSASLIASCSTGDQIKDGFKVGSSIQIRAWKQVSDSETQVQTAILSGSLNYLKNASTMVKMRSTTTSISNPVDITQVEVFPNPSQGQFTVRFSDLPSNGSHIDIYDISGRKLSSRQITGISEEFELFGQPAGIYLVKSILGSVEKITKLVIQ